MGAEVVSLLTIAIPTRNRGKYLIETLDSIIKQDEFNNIKVVVCNNNSSDDTDEMMKDYIHFDNINYICNNELLSIDDNMMKVASFVKTKYFLWLGDDDFIVSGGIKKILNYLKFNDYNFILLSASRVSENLQINFGCNLESSMKDIKISGNVLYKNPNIFFLKHCFHMPFGTLLVRKKSYDLVIKKNKRFRGTSHAYSGLVFDYLAKEYLRDNYVEILLVREELIMLRQIEKTWKKNAMKIMFQEIPEWLYLFDKSYFFEVEITVKYYLDLQFKIRSLISRSLYGYINFKNFKEHTKYANHIQKLKYIFACLLPTIKRVE